MIDEDIQSVMDVFDKDGNQTFNVVRLASPLTFKKGEDYSHSPA